MSEFFTWELLASFAGATLATGIVTQFVKGWFSKIPTQAVSYVIALVVLCAATAATGGAGTWADWAILPINAILISLASNGAYEAVNRIAKV